MAIDNEALLAAIDAAQETSYGSDEHSELGQRRARAIEYYLGVNVDPAPMGRSQVVDRSVYETISTLLPPLVRIFASSSEEVCKAMPVGPDDEQAAEQQTAVLNHVVTQQNQWEQICADWIHDAALLCNGYAMAYWDESKRLVREVYEGQSDDQVASLVSDKSIKVIQHSQSLDKQATADAQAAFKQAMQQYAQMQQQTQMAAQAGQQVPPLPPPPQPPQPVMLHDLVIERAENDGKCCIKVLPPEHCKVSAATPDWTLRDCPYFEYGQEMPIADLRAMGLDVPDNISDNENSDTDEDDARDRFGEDDDRDNTKGLMRRVWTRSVWIRADVEGDDESRLYYCIIVGKTVLWAEPVARIPVSSMVAQPMPHRHIGMSVSETVEDLQDIKTAVTRGGLDNLYLANNGRHVISDRVNLADMLDSRPGGVIRLMKGSLPGEGHVAPLVHPFAFDSIIGSLEYFDQTRQNRTGVMRGAAGLEANALNRAAVGTTIAMQGAMAMRTEHIARMMAPAVENLFSCVQEVIAKHQNKAMTIQLRGGEWVTVDPQAWRKNRDIRISVGVGAGNKDAMIQSLQMQLGAQMQLSALGLAGPEEIYETVMEVSKLNGYANPRKFWRDVRRTPPPPPQPGPDQIKAQSALQLKQMDLQADAQKFQAEMMHKAQEQERAYQAKLAELRMQYELQASNDQRDFERENTKAMLDAQLEQAKQENDKQIALMKAEIDKYKADLDADVRLTIAGLPSEAETKAKEDANALQSQLDELIAQLAQPTEIIRGDDGRAVAVKKGGIVRPVIRGADGRPVGLQ